MTDLNNHFQGTEKAKRGPIRSNPITLTLPSCLAHFQRRWLAASAHVVDLNLTVLPPCARRNTGTLPTFTHAWFSAAHLPPPRRPPRAYKKQQPCPLVRAD